MDTIILEIINAYGLALLKVMVLLIAGTFGLILCKLANRYLDTETKRTLARTGVLFVEQVFKNLHGKEKMDKYLEYVAARLKVYGIKFDVDEMKALAEAFLAEFNNAFHRPGVILEGIDVDDLDDDQLREVLKQCGFAYADNMSRDEMLAALDEAAVQVNT